MALQAIIIKKTLKEYVGIVGIYIKTEKAQEQDGFGNKMKHVTIVQLFVIKIPTSSFIFEYISILFLFQFYF